MGVNKICRRPACRLPAGFTAGVEHVGGQAGTGRHPDVNRDLCLLLNGMWWRSGVYQYT
jgi:hypothetical protein